MTTQELEEAVQRAIEGAQPCGQIDAVSERQRHLQYLADRRTLAEVGMVELRSRARTFFALVGHALAVDLTSDEILEVSDSIEDLVACLARSFETIERVASAAR